jgi:hypothetical protein
VAKKRDRTNLRGADVDVLQIVALQSGEPSRIRRVLDPRNRLSASTLPHVIPLLGDRVVGGAAMQALQLVADAHPRTLIDALLNPAHRPKLRRRLARVLSVCRSQAVADGLLLALDDEQFEIRVQCARSLFRIRRRYPDIRVDTDRLFDLVRAELRRGAADLAHLFTLLSFVVSVRPLRAAYRGIRGGDVRAKGTALEYLHGVLPKDIRAEVLGKLGS